MASTYTVNAGIELIANGEQSGTWGDTTNVNLQIIDRLANGVGSISLSGTTHTLTTSDGALSDGQYAVLVFGGSPTGTNTVTISPNNAQHLYLVKNSSGESVVLTQGSGSDITLADGESKIVYADGAGSGAAVVDLTSTLSMSDVSITGGSISGITDLTVADGGTGVSDTPANGELLIGNGSGYTVATLTEGTNVSISNASGEITIAADGSVSSVDASGGTTGLTFSGGPITSSGTLTVAGTLAATNGGTGLTSLGTGIATWLGTPSSANLASAVTDETGSGALVFSTSPTLVTPALGTPSSGVLDNCTVNGTDDVGYRNIPQVSKSSDYTLELGDAGKHIFHPSADTTDRTFTIPANGSVAYPVGTALTFVNASTGDVFIAINSDTLYFAGGGATGTRTLSQYGVATAVKVTSTEWFISGAGLS